MFVRLFMTLLLLCGLACDRKSESTGDSPQKTKPSITQSSSALRPLPEYEGSIQQVIIHQPSKYVGPSWRAVHDLLTAMPNATFTFFTDNSEGATELVGRIRQWKFSENNNTRILQVDSPILIWARDRYIATRREGKGDLPEWLMPLPPESFDRERRMAERGVVAEFNAVQTTCTEYPIELVLEGGNLVASETNVYIGANVISDNGAIGDSEKVKAELKRLFGDGVVTVGDDEGRVPLDHVDMYLTAIAEKHVLVGSPALAQEIMKDADEASKKALDQRLYITPNMPPPVGPDYRDERIAIFDSIAAQLEKAGIKVTRIPYVDCRGGDFVVTYNNVLQERRNGEHIVYMPVYKIPALDAAARKVYESLGMTVNEIDVSTICHLLGAVRCLANVVERGP